MPYNVLELHMKWRGDPNGTSFELDRRLDRGDPRPACPGARRDGSPRVGLAAVEEQTSKST